jgi:hypothetical protein
VLKLRREFWENIRDIQVEDLIFIDEAGVNLAMGKLYARALKGKRAYGTRPQKRGKNVPLKTFFIGSLTAATVLHLFEKRYIVKIETIDFYR